MSSTRGVFGAHLTRRRVIVMMFVGLALAFIARSTPSHASDPTAAAIENGLQSLATATQGLATPPAADTPDHLSFLGKNVPLTGLSPLSSDGLSLGDLVHQALAASGSDLDDPGALASALNHRDATLADGVHVTLGCGDGTAACGHPVTISPTAGGQPSYDMTLPFAATRTVSVPIALATDAADIDGPSTSNGEVQVVLSASSTFTIHYDTNNADATQKFTLVTPPVLHLTGALSTPTGLSFPADLGFTKLTVTAPSSPTPVVSLSLDVAFASPHPGGTAQAGHITEYDLQNTALADYVTVTRGGSVNASLGLDTDLTASSPDLSLTVADSDLANGFQPTYNGGNNLSGAISGGSLADFTNVTPTQVLSGLGQLAASIQSLQTSADFHLPLLQNGLSGSLKLVDDLVAALAQQTVVCGSVDANPPSGPVFGLPSGTHVFCQATTTDTVNGGSVTWTGVGGTATAVAHTSGAAADGTIGTVPTTRAEFTTTADNIPPVITANYTTGSPAVTKGVSQPVPTAQDLLNLLIHNAGFSDTSITGHLPTSVHYDPTAHTLVFHLLKTIPTGTTQTGALDFGDRFKDSTGLFGLSSAVDGAGHPTSTVSMSASNAVIDLSFGIILTQDLNDISTHSTPPSFLDRFFVQVAPGVHPFSVDSATVNVATHLVGQLGFLEITADPPSSGTNFSLTKLDSTKPVVSLDVIPHPAGPDPSTDPAEPLSFTVDGNAIDNALPVALLLSHVTKHVSVTPNVHLTGGVTVAANVGSNELAHGGVTFDWPVDSLSELTSASHFTTTTDSDFSSSLEKFWDMAKDDPQALLQVILDQLSQLAASAATTDGDGSSVFDTQLPLVGTTPRQLLKQYTRLKEAVDELKGGAPSANITCVDTSAGDGPVDSAPAGHTIGCVGTAPDAASAAQWHAFAGTNEITGANGSDAASVGTTLPGAAHRFTFVVPAGVTGLATIANPGGFRVHVDFDSTSGHHTADNPALNSPPTLQSLAQALTSKLGLPSNALQVTIAQLKKPGGSAVPTLKLGLAYDLCTAGNTKLPACPSNGAGNTIPAINVPMSVNLGPLGGSGDHPLQTQGNIGVEVNGHAQIDLGFPLDITTGNLPVPEVLGTTKASLQAALDGSFGAQASLGPLSLQIGTSAPDKDGNAGQGTGTFKLGGKVSVARDDAADDQGYTPADFLSHLHGAFTNTDSNDGGVNGAQSCGDVDSDYTDDATDPDPTPPHTLSGVVCGNMSLGISDGFIGSVGLEWTDFSAAPTVYYPSDLLNRIASLAFDPDFLLKALPQLLAQLQTTLSNANSTVKLPVLGDALDAGANIVGQFKTGLVDPVVNGLDAAIGAVGNPKEIHEKVQQFMFTQLGPSGANILLDNDGSGTVDKADVIFAIHCAVGAATPGDCNADTTAGDLQYIDDAHFDFQIGGGVGNDPTADTGACAGASPPSSCATPSNVPFDIGMDGVPLRIQGALAPHVGWRMRLNFGMSRDDGPYLVVNHTGGGHDLVLGAGVGLGDAPCSSADDGYLTSNVSSSEFGKYNTTRCLTGTLGFLEVHVRDADGSDTNKHKRTGIELQATLDVKGTGVGNNGKLTLANLTSIGADFGITADADVNVFVRAGITGTGKGFPSVAGTFHAGFSWGAGSGLTDRHFDGSGPEFDNLYLDAGQFLKNFLQPIVQQVQSVTSPLKPIIDTLQAPIPVVSQLAELVGEDPVTLIDLAEAASGSDLSVVKSIIDLIQFINSFNFQQTGDLLIPLGSGSGGGGSFGLSPAQVDSPQPSDENAANALISNPVSGDISSQITGASAAAPDPPSDGRPTTFGVPGLNIPWLHDPGQIFKLLMGQDITLIDYQFGGLHASASFSYTFGPFLVGPVPVSIVIGGSVDINGHLGIGYDTTGLREVINGGGADKLLDGLFFDTYDSSGHEVPVIQLIGTVTAGAEVDLVIVKAGIEAGLQLTVNFFFDDPTPDGKMSLPDIAGKLDNPICLFKVTGSLDAFIKAFVEIDLFLFSDRFEFTILQLHLLDFSAACSPPPPVPATNVGGVLKINIGPRADQRHFHFDAAKWGDPNDDQNKEEVVVRAIAPSGSHKVSVTMFGYYAEYSGVNSIEADGGIGNDKITLAPGSRTTGTTPLPSPPGGTRPCTAANPCNDVPFELPAVIAGGAGDDVIVGGDGNDNLNGDGGATPTPAGSDTISGNGGDDTIQGGPGGTDNMSGDKGTDHIYGGTWNGSSFTSGTGPVVIEGGPGGDFLYGSDAGDNIDGGPGLDPSAPDPGHAGQTFGQSQPDAVDGADVIVGSKGPDSLTGGPGGDTISGDEDLTSDTGCVADGAAPDTVDAAHHQTSNDDVIDAGDGNDHVWAGSGNDNVKGGKGSNFLCGNAGDDTMEGNPANGSTNDHSTIVGGPDQDILSSGPGDSLIIGGSGNDRTTPGIGNDIVIGGLGRDTVSGGGGDDIELGDDGTVGGDDPPTLAALSPSALETLIAGLHGQDLLTRASHVTGSTGSDTGATLNCVAAYNQLDVTSGNSDCVTGADGSDVVYAGPGADTVSGDDAADYLDGGSGPDTMRGVQGDDYLYGRAGDDTLFGDSGADHIYGNDDKDAIHGGSGADYIEGNGSADTINGDSGADNILGGSSTAGAEDANNPSGDTILGGEDDDVIVGDNGTINETTRAVVIFDNNDAPALGHFNDDAIFGNEGIDRIYGGGGVDTVHGNELGDYIEGNAGADILFGDEGSDHILGGSHQDAATANDAGDTVRGGPDDDVIIGDNGTINADGTTSMAVSPANTFGNDQIHGDGGYDQVYGELGDDNINGDDGADYLVGDLGAITAASSPATWPGGAPHDNVLLISPENGGIDTMFGGAKDDHMYGGPGADVMQGNSGNDYMEGNNGQDSMYGLNDGVTAGDTLLTVDTAAGAPLPFGEGDEDDMLGGSSAVNPESDRLDVGETIMQGNLGTDVMIGDNGEIVRTPASATAWQQDPITGGTARTVTLFYADRANCSSGVCGGDTMEGDEANDRIYGEGGNDVIHGNLDNDYIEGNQNDDAFSAPAVEYGDTLFGDAGEDDLIGGSSQIGSCAGGDAPCGEPDAGDTVHGGGDADVAAGDNAVVTKVISPATGDKLTQRTGMLNQRTITLLDLGDHPTSGTSGGDRVFGDDGVDVIFGQSGNDRINGNNDDDYAEGGPGSDWVQGDNGDDDLIGGSSRLFTADNGAATQGQLDQADVVSGGAGDDLITGDNSVILRVGTPSPYVFRVGSLGAIETQRSLRLLDLQWSNGFLGGPTRTVFGSDQLSGGSGVDVIFGQDGDDQISGGAGDDYAEGNGGQDAMYGDRTLAEAGIAALSASPAWPGPVSGDPGNVSSVNGQDDLVGGSSTQAFRDLSDAIHGDGGADYELGDNGTVVRDILDATKAPVPDLTAASTAQLPLVDRVYTLRYPSVLPLGAAYVRHGTAGAPTRFCTTGQSTCEPTGAFGGDNVWGDSGDDTLYGQDGDDHLYGDTGSDAKADPGSLLVVYDGGPPHTPDADSSNDDDLYGELGNDSLWGESGDDAELGDRGGIRDVYQTGSNHFFQSVNQVPKVEYDGFSAGTVTRVVDLLHDVNGDAFLGSGTSASMPHNGMLEGGDDRIRGGTNHDSMHGGFGDDLMNGDSGGDALFGDDGADVMWGGKGCDQQTDTAISAPYCYPGGNFDPAPHNANGETVPQVTDYLNGGKGGSSAASVASASGSDILDWHPRGSYTGTPGCTPNSWPVDVTTGKGKTAVVTTIDPCSWFDMTNLDDGDNANPVNNNQHHQGVDWQYGGWDRDVLQGDVADNGPNEGDRLLDWNGTYNMYTHCNSAYGGYNDVRQHSPNWQDFLQHWIWAQGAGQSLADSTTSGTSAFDELALVYPGSDNAHGSGSAYPSTPGHFDNPNSCAP